MNFHYLFLKLPLYPVFDIERIDKWRLVDFLHEAMFLLIVRASLSKHVTFCHISLALTHPRRIQATNEQGASTADKSKQEERENSANEDYAVDDRQD